ncbi:MAG: 2-oxo acid dehydrogenase subunit E2 [Verrucomicrobia bacterium]|nr:2-oxo acid dehydrogenase subunit E2 [Verrucomicrobiota bacterium]
MNINLPPLGEGADSGTVVTVFVKAGDTITEGQTLLELENEKAIASIPASAGGVVSQVYVKAGDKLNVGQRILSLAGSESTAPTPAAAPPAASPAAAPAAAAPTAAPALEASAAVVDTDFPEPVAAPVASPSIRRIARELGIDLARVRGSEAGGRIVTSDIRAYIEKLQQVALKPKTAAAAPPSGAPTAPPAPVSVDFSKWGPIQRQPTTMLRQTIARRMAENWQTIPHVTQFADADFTRLNALRKQFGPAYAAKGARLTVTPLLLRALVDTLKQHSVFNCSLDEATQDIVYKEYFHIGIAVDTEQGLLVPVVRDADKKSLLDLAQELETLAQRARERKVAREEMQGGTFTISNQGAIGGAHFTPIINKPEVAILGIGRGALRPAVRPDGQIEPRLLVPLALSYDHRLIDGGAAARFTVDFLRALEEFPESAVAL